MFQTTLLLVLSSALPSLVSATCYWQNSTLAPNDRYSIAQDDVACFPGQTNSPCCATGWSCLSDGVCYIEQEGEGFYYRGTCTDKTWNSQQCPGWCFAEDATTSIPLIKCNKADGQDWYCCPSDPNCSCDTGKDAIKLGATQPVTATVIGSTSWPGFISTTVTAGNIAAQGTTTSADSDTSATSTSNASGSLIAGQTTATASASASSTDAAKPASNTAALAAGLGAGIGAAAVVFGAGATIFIMRSRRRRSASGDNNNNIYPNPFGGSYSGSPYANGSQYKPLPHHSPPTTGYYATSVVNEKDGRQAFKTQELPGHSSQNGNGVLSHDNNVPAEMMGSSHHPGATVSWSATLSTQGRVELA